MIIANLGSALLQNAISADDRFSHAIAITTDLEVLQRLCLWAPQNLTQKQQR